MIDIKSDEQADLRAFPSVVRLVGAALWIALIGCRTPTIANRPPDTDCVRAFTAPQVPDPADVTVIDLEGVRFFHLQYGTPQDCPSGCFSSSAIGLMWSCDRIKWLGLTDYDDVTIARERYVTESELAGLDIEARVAARAPGYGESLGRALAGLAASSPSLGCRGVECRARLDTRLAKEGTDSVERLLSLHPLDRGLHQLALVSLDDEPRALALWRTTRGRWHDFSYPDCEVPASCVEKAEALVRAGKPGLARLRYEDACSREDARASRPSCAWAKTSRRRGTSSRAPAGTDTWHRASRLRGACVRREICGTQRSSWVMRASRSMFRRALPGARWRVSSARNRMPAGAGGCSSASMARASGSTRRPCARCSARGRTIRSRAGQRPGAARDLRTSRCS